MAHTSLADGFFVYVHSRLGSGEPFYVGKGRRERAFEQTRRNSYWKRIVAKDGGRYCNFVIERADEELAHLIEREMILKLRDAGAILANITDGGETKSGWKMTEEQRAKCRAAQKKRVRAKLSEEHKRNIGLASLGRRYPNRKPHTEERKAQIGAFHKGKQHTLGHKLSAEHKAKVSVSLIGNKRAVGGRGRTLTAEHRAKLSLAAIARERRRRS